MAQVGRQVHVRVSLAGGVQGAVSSTTDDGHAAHGRCLVASHKQSGGARGKDCGDVVGEGTKGCLGYRAHPPQANLVPLGVRAAGFKRNGVAQADEVGEGGGDAPSATSAFVCALKSAMS